MGGETVFSVLILVVAVMLCQALIGLASSIQDLYGKLLAGGIIHTWAAEKREKYYGTNNPTGIFNRVKDEQGNFNLEASTPSLDEEKEPPEEAENWNPYYSWKM